jgi:serine protease Do
MNSCDPITAMICEVQGSGDSKLPIRPEGSDSFDLFSFSHPFGLRKAIVPVLLNDVDGITKGMGTAFHIDGWGTFLTADHVIESVRRRSMRAASSGDEIRLEIGHPDMCPILLLGIGLVYGQLEVPPSALARVVSIQSPIREREDPLSALIGQTPIEAASDIAVMQVAGPIPDKMIGSLAIRSSGVAPAIGDAVVALGFPDLDCQPIDDKAIQYLMSDGMSGAYGRIIDVHPKGLHNDPTPVIEVEANWPSGMSGGPVFNARGEVLGVVSRSWLPSGGKPGIGYGACLSMMPWLRKWLPTVDHANPCWRVGWAVMNNSREMIAFYKDKNEAICHQTILGTHFSLAFGSNRIGTTEFVHKTPAS